MRDLYRHLRISPRASHEEIRSAIQICQDAAVCSDAQAVLLKPARRKIYDSHHRILIQIGLLRADLDLNDTPFWQDETGHEFRFKKSPAPVQNKPQKDQSDRCLWGLCLGGIAISGIILWSAWQGHSLSGKAYYHQTPTPAPTPITFYPKSAQQFTDGHEVRRAIPIATPVFNQRPSPKPRSGEIRNFTAKSALAPLRINTSGSSDYVVKLVDSRTKSAALMVYITGGSSIEIDVPLGIYEVRYASGEMWYGYNYLFGPKTVYSKADRLLSFQRTADGYEGYTITLYAVPNGNLETQQIHPEDF